MPHSTEGGAGVCLERGCCGLGGGDFAGIPLFVFVDGNDADFGLHVVVAGAAELAAGEFEVCGAGGGELHPLDGAARDGVLVEAEGRDIEGVDHIAGAKEHMNGLTNGNNELGGGKVVLASGISGIDAEFVFQTEAFDIASAQLAIGSGIAHVPAILISYDIDSDGIWRNR